MTCGETIVVLSVCVLFLLLVFLSMSEYYDSET
jgi:hypothetical protein